LAQALRDQDRSFSEWLLAKKMDKEYVLDSYSM
jgi:hypothetical protein